MSVFREGLRFERAGNGERDLVPLRGFLAELFAARAGERVVLRAPVVLRRLPGGSQPSGFFQTVQCRKQGTGLDDERPVRELFDAARDAKAVELSGRERLQDEQVEGALQQCGRSARHRVKFLSTFDRSSVSVRLVPLRCQYRGQPGQNGPTVRLEARS